MRKAWYLGCLPGVLEVDPQVGALGLGALGGVVRLDGVPTHAAAFCNTINSFLICYVWNLITQFTLFRLLFMESPFYYHSLYVDRSCTNRCTYVSSFSSS